MYLAPKKKQSPKKKPLLHNLQCTKLTKKNFAQNFLEPRVQYYIYILGHGNQYIKRMKDRCGEKRERGYHLCNDSEQQERILYI